MLLECLDAQAAHGGGEGRVPLRLGYGPVELQTGAVRRLLVVLDSQAPGLRLEALGQEVADAQCDGVEVDRMAAHEPAHLPAPVGIRVGLSIGQGLGGFRGSGRCGRCSGALRHSRSAESWHRTASPTRRPLH